MGKNRSQVTVATPPHLFDAGKRTYMGIADHDESHFTFLNRSAWASVATARKTLGNWFSALPEKKMEDIRSRFRSDDRQHQGALLELASFQLLRSICTSVQMDPSINNLTPDFLATFGGSDIVIECTVAQESDDDFNATQRESRIKTAINSVDTGRFRLVWELLTAGDRQPTTGNLCGKIKNWVDSLDVNEETRRLQRGSRPRMLEWRKDGWELLLEAIPADSCTTKNGNGRAIGMEISGGGGWRQDDAKLKKALTKKAAKYRHFALPYLVILSSGSEYVFGQDLIEALFGHSILRLYVQPDGSEPIPQPGHEYDGLFGSPSAPRNRHLSAIIFKPRIGVWTLCGHDDPWLLIHNPWADYPLPTGMFPFAAEWILESGGFAKVEPTVTLNTVLGLAYPWPGMER